MLSAKWNIIRMLLFRLDSVSFYLPVYLAIRNDLSYFVRPRSEQCKMEIRRGPFSEKARSLLAIIRFGCLHCERRSIIIQEVSLIL